MKKLICSLVVFSTFLFAQTYTAEGDGLVKIYEDESGISGNYLIIKGYSYYIKHLKIQNQEVALQGDDFTVRLLNKNLPDSLKIRAITKKNELIEGEWLVPHKADTSEKYSQSKRAHSCLIYAGLKPWSYDYKETLDLPLKSTESSTRLLNVFGGMTLYDPGDVFFINGEVDLGGGVTQYDGSTQTGTPVTDTTDNSWLDMVLKGGVKLKSGNAVWNLYTGIGYYSWTRILGGDYKEVYSWLYMPAGFSMDYFFSQNFSLGLDAGVKQMLAGNIGIWFDANSNDTADLNLRLGNRMGYYYSLPMKIYVDDFTLTCAPYFESRPIGRSTTGTFSDSYYIYEIYEPSSTAYMKGVKLWAGYSF